jgi:4-aminobutyrate aminotransferase-like enzyme
MQYLYDEHGKRYLDCFGGIVTVSCGHCHPDIVNAVVEQTKLLQHTTTIYLHHAIVEFAEALTSKMPGNLKVKIMSPLWCAHSTANSLHTHIYSYVHLTLVGGATGCVLCQFRD